MKQAINRIFRQMNEDALSRKKVKGIRKKAFPCLADLRSMLVLWDATEDRTACLKLLERKFPGVKIDKVCVVPDKEGMREEEGVTQVCPAEIGFLGKLKNPALLQLLSKPYDLFVDLTSVSHVLTEYIRRSTLSACRTGIWKEEETDLRIEGVLDSLDFIEKLYRVLSKYKKY